MSKVEVVSDLVHLSGNISTPIIAVNGIPAVDICIGNPAHCIRRETIHDMIGKITCRSAEDIEEFARDSVAHHAISIRGTYRGQIYGNYPIRYVSVRSSFGICLDEVELVMTASRVLRCEIDGIHPIAEDTVANKGFAGSGGIIQRVDANGEHSLVPSRTANRRCNSARARPCSSVVPGDASRSRRSPKISDKTSGALPFMLALPLAISGVPTGRVMRERPETIP